MYWSWMNCGHLYMQSALNDGFGLPCRRTRQIVSYFIGDRGIGSCRAFWNLTPKEYRRCFRLVIYGRHTKMLLTRAGIKWSERGLAKPPMSNAGTTHFDKEFADLSEKHCPFQRAIKCTKLICIYSYSITTCHS